MTRKPNPPPKPVCVSEHLASAEEAQRNIDVCRAAMEPYLQVQRETQAKLEALSPRYQARDERKNAAYQAVEVAIGRYEQSRTDADVAVGVQVRAAAAAAFLDAECGVTAAKADLRKTLAQLEKEEDVDNTDAALQQRSNNSARVQIAKLERQIEKLEVSKAKALAAHGEQEKRLLSLSFQQLDDQEAGAIAALETIKRQREKLVVEAATRLQEYPELLTAVLRNVPFQDQVTELLSSNLDYRRAIAGLPTNPIYWIEWQNVPARFLEVTPLDTSPDIMQLDLVDIEKWVASYKERR